jgi:hypothetical protein
MSEENKQKLEVLYEQLLSLYHGLGEPKSSESIGGGPFDQYFNAIQSLQELSGQNLQHFLPHTWEGGSGQRWGHTRDLKVQIGGLLGWLRANYLTERAPHYAQDQHVSTSISQTVNQEVNVMQVVTLDITEKLTAKQSEFREGTKERGFIEKVKAGLRGVKDTASLLALITQTAQQLGLSIEQLHKIFS